MEGNKGRCREGCGERCGRWGKVRGDVGRSMGGVGRCGGNAERGGERCAGVRGSVVKGEGERG